MDVRRDQDAGAEGRLGGNVGGEGQICSKEKLLDKLRYGNYDLEESYPTLSPSEILITIVLEKEIKSKRTREVQPIIRAIALQGPNFSTLYRNNNVSQKLKKT